MAPRRPEGDDLEPADAPVALPNNFAKQRGSEATMSELGVPRVPGGAEDRPLVVPPDTTDLEQIQRRQLAPHAAAMLPGNDFWLIDDTLLFNLASGDGDWLGVQPNDCTDVIAFCATSFEAAWARAIDHSNYRPT